MSDEWQRKVEALVDPDVYANDAQYHAQVTQFKQWLRMVETAMRDEWIEPNQRERVINRLVYGTPSGMEAHERMAQLRERVEMMKTAQPEIRLDASIFDGD